MKSKLIPGISLVLLLTTAAGLSQTIFFEDNFGNGSTLDGLSIPGGTSTASFTSYDLASSKIATNSTIAPGLLSCKLSTGTSSGYWEVQALFSTNAVQLVEPGDYVDLAIVFTNSQNTLLTGNVSPIWIGLYNSGETPGTTTNPPTPGDLVSNGLNTTSGSPYATGNCEPWQGYLAQPNSAVGSSIITRPVQNAGATTSANQELLGNGVSGGTFNNPKGSTLDTSAAQTFSLPTSGPSTMDLRITLDPAGSGDLIISNAVYIGAGTGSTPVFTNSVKTSTILATAFDGLAFGAFNHNGTANPQMDVSSITVIGHSSQVTTPPSITSQPSSVLVATNGYCMFNITAQGVDVTYQWYRDGTKLVDGGDISGVTTSNLVVFPAQSQDAFSGGDGYFCLVTGEGGYSANSATNSLTLVPATNLTWTASSGTTWDVDTTPNFVDPNNIPAVFTDGDPVTFNDTAGDEDLTLSGYLAPASMTVTTGQGYTFSGSGSIVGPCSVVFSGTGSQNSGEVILNATNTYSGGTILTNGIYLDLKSYAGLGTGPVTLNEADGEMEIVPAGTASSGIVGDTVVADDFTILPDAAGSFGAVFLGNLSGTSGKTLTINLGPNNPGTSTRIRAYGTNTVYNANLDLASSEILFAPYSTNGSQTYNGIISGPGAIMQKGTFSYLNAQNTYTGGTYPAAGAIGLGVSSESSGGNLSSGPLGTGPIILMPDSTTTLTGDGEIFASGGSITIGNPIQYASGTNNLSLFVGGSENLTLAGPFTLQGNDDLTTNTFTSRTIQVTNTALTTITGLISDGGLNYGFNLTGSGILALEQNETYTGPTTISGGTLLVDGKIGPGAVLATNGFLGGIGTISGNVTVEDGGGIKPGDQPVPGVLTIGTLTINGSLTISNGTTSSVAVNESASTYDQVSANSIAYAGTLYATNLAGALSIGDSFKVFNTSSPTGNFTNVIGSPGAGLAWAFNPTSGMLSVVQGIVIPTVPARITSFSISGENVNITATNGVNGGTYYLLGTTNLALPLSQWTAVATNVVTSSGGTEVFSFIGTNVYSISKPHQFLTLSNTNN